jgi:hypothetical protein
MASSADAMDQIKEYIRLAIKYRFWIAVGLAALLPMIAYFAGTGAITAQANAEKGKIESADKNVKQYATKVVKNQQWTNAVKEKTGVLTKDINLAWKELYERQAPLLTWPTGPRKEPLPFKEWGKKWPAGVDDTEVTLVTGKYILAYNRFVDEVYQTCNPWDPQTGKGIVVAPPKEILLQPATFDPNNPPTDLSVIWSAQEKLWVQRALLDVVAKVNKNAKDWDSAVIKRIESLVVATSDALDQVSIAKGETLKAPDKIKSPNAPPEPEEGAGGGGGGGGTGSYGMSVPGGGGGRAMPGGPGSSGMMGSSGYGGSGGMGLGGQQTTTVQYLSSSNEQFNVVPVAMTVLIDQNYINNLLTELANSPMSIQVTDYEQSRPDARVTKPVKGESLDFGGMMGSMGGYGGMRGAMSRMFNMGGYGSSNYGQMMMSRGVMPGGYGGAGYGAMGARGGYGGLGGASKQTEHGKDVRSRDFKKEAEEKQEAAKKIVGNIGKIHDPYYYILKVTVYGQARFYNPPPPEATAESPGEATATVETEAKPADQAGAAGTPEKAEPKPKAEAEPKAEADAQTEPEKTDEAQPKAKAPDDASKDSAPKEEAKDQAQPKAEAQDTPNPPPTEAEKSDDTSQKPAATPKAARH